MAADERLTAMTTTANAPTAAPRWAKAAGWFGLVAHVAVGLPYASTAVIAPSWAVAAVVVLWAVLLVVAIYLLNRRPLLTPLVPAGAFALWVLILVAGTQLLGWTG